MRDQEDQVGTTAGIAEELMQAEPDERTADTLTDAVRGEEAVIEESDTGKEADYQNVMEDELVEMVSPDEQAASGRKRRTQRTYPALSFSEALVLGRAIYDFAAGQRTRRVTLLDRMGKSENSSSTRTLISSSNQYGVTSGAYNATYLELTPDGLNAVSNEVSKEIQLESQLNLAIAGVAPFAQIYEIYKDNRLPDRSVLRDKAVEIGIPEDNAFECVDIFLANARDLGLIQTLAGTERLLTFDHRLENYGGSTSSRLVPRAEATSIAGGPPKGNEADQVAAVKSQAESDRSGTKRVSITTRRGRVVPVSVFDNVCFHITPIGSEGSEQRRHADLVTGAILEPAMDEIGLRLVRADKIAEPGQITSQVIEHLLFSRLVVADLSYSNPNVFYELAIRHATRKPVVQFTRTADAIPFDVGQSRTIRMNMSDIYSFVPQLDFHRAEVIRQCRAAVDSEGPTDNTLSLFYPEFWDYLDVDQ
jgi:hypothetical protein